MNYNTKELSETNQDLLTYIDSLKKESSVYPEQNTLHFEKVANITVDRDSTTPKKKKKGDRKIVIKIVISLSIKMRRIRVLL